MKRALFLGLITLLLSAAGYSLTAMTEEENEKNRAEYKRKHEEKMAAYRRELAVKKANLWATKHTPIIADEKEIDAQEPFSADDLLNNLRDHIPGEKLFWSGKVPGSRVARFDSWSFKKEDFTALLPAESEIYLTISPTLRYFILPYSITNSTAREVILYPRIWIRTAMGRLSQEIGGFLVKKQVAASIFEDVYTTQEFIADIETKRPGVEKVGVLAPGETRWGVAIFPSLDPEMDEMTVVVEGISNAYNFMKMHRPILCLAYTRYGDEFHPQLDHFAYVDKKWHSQWMWWEETRMGRPERIEVLGPAGEREHVLWVFDLHIKNSMGEDRNLTISNISTVLGMADPFRKTRPIKVLDDISVTVRLVDDGDSTIYKVDAFEAASRPIETIRFHDGTIEKDREITIPVAFEEVDVDWDDVYRQVAEAITPSSSAIYRSVFVGAAERDDVLALKQALASPLDEELKLRIRKEVREQIPEALQEAFDNRHFTLELTGDAKLATGTYRVVRDFIRRTTIDNRLIKDWGH